MRINPFDIMREVENHYTLEPGAIVFHRRTKTRALARAIAMYLTRELTTYSWIEIAEHFERDTSTVMYNCKRIEKMLKKDSSSGTKESTLELRNALLNRGS